MESPKSWSKGRLSRKYIFLALSINWDAIDLMSSFVIVSVHLHGHTLSVWNPRGGLLSGHEYSEETIYNPPAKTKTKKNNNPCQLPESLALWFAVH